MALATVLDYSRPTTPDHSPNGIASPRTLKNTGLALTEYTANSSPLLELAQTRPHNVIPNAFLLPNSYPNYLYLILTSRVYNIIKYISI